MCNPVQIKAPWGSPWTRRADACMWPQTGNHKGVLSRFHAGRLHTKAYETCLSRTQANLLSRQAGRRRTSAVSLSTVSLIQSRMSLRAFSRGSSFAACPRPSLEKALVFISFSHTLKRSICRSTSFRAFMRSDLSLMSVPEILQVQRQLHSLITAKGACFVSETTNLVCMPSLAFAICMPSKHGKHGAASQPKHAAQKETEGCTIS